MLGHSRHSLNVKPPFLLCPMCLLAARVRVRHAPEGLG